MVAPTAALGSSPAPPCFPPECKHRSFKAGLKQIGYLHALTSIYIDSHFKVQPSVDPSIPVNICPDASIPVSNYPDALKTLAHETV